MRFSRLATPGLMTLTLAFGQPAYASPDATGQPDNNEFITIRLSKRL